MLVYYNYGVQYVGGLNITGVTFFDDVIIVQSGLEEIPKDIRGISMEGSITDTHAKTFIPKFPDYINPT